MKVGKKTPLTRKHFDDFFARLPKREESEQSWTLVLAARKAKAADDARPYHAAARSKSQEADGVKDRLSRWKKAKPRDDAAIAEAEKTVAALLRESRDNAAKAETIENAAYALKAVNSNRKTVVDALMDLIDAKGREVAATLSRLRGLCASDGAAAPVSSDA